MIKKSIMYLKLLSIFISIVCLLFMTGCFDKMPFPVGPGHGSHAKSIKIGVFSDPHYYDPTLGTTSEAFQMYITYDRKMIAESEAITEATVAALNAEDLDVVLVPGDLTKDGGKQCHDKFAGYLSEIEATGKRVFVVPGNHDINNPHAASYPDGSPPVPIPSVSPEQFADIYEEFGYGEAVFKDPHSLSYMARLTDKIWLIAIDACLYGKKYPELGHTAGKISQPSMNWIKNKLKLAKKHNITVFGMMHHGVVEHFPGMENVFPEYIVNDWQNVSEDFANWGLKVVFTGHHHATDIAQHYSSDGFICDVQTGSSVTWQCPYRIVNYNGKTKDLTIENKVINHINYDTGGLPFQAYAYNFLASGMPVLVVGQLQLLGATEAQAVALEPLVTPTMISYYRGDEPELQDPTLMAAIQGLVGVPDPMAQMIGYLLLGIWTDPTPDNNVTINMENGAISKN